MTRKATPRPFFFIQISDPQFGMLAPGADAYLETPLVERAVARINELAPAFVICNGDLTNEPGSDVQLDEAQRLLGGINSGIPFYAVPGNHDIGEVPTPANLAWYRRRVGPDWYAFDHGGRHFVGLNSCLIADGSQAPADAQEQWDWLNADLARADGDATVVFMHHPFFLERADEPDNYFNINVAARARYLALLRRHRVAIVLAGHLHRNNVAVDGDLTVLASGPVGMPLGEEGSGLRIVRIGPGRFEHRYFELDDAAAQVAFATAAF